MASEATQTNGTLEAVRAQPRTSVGKQDRHFVTALSRGLDVLACFRSGSRLLGNQDISERCKLPKSTVSRLTYTLTKLGYLHYVRESGKYRLGTATLALGSAVLGRFEVRDIAGPLMQELADATGASISLCARQRLNMVCVEVCKGSAVLSLNMEVGLRLPLATSAIGRSYLAICSDSERAELMEQLREQEPAEWPTLQAGIEEARQLFDRSGVCLSLGDWQPDVHGIAASFRPGNGLPPMAINCGGAAQRLPADYLMNEVAPRLVEMVRRIEEGLGQTRM